MKSKTQLLAAGLIASVSLTMSSCQDEDFGYTAEQIAYHTNFEKAFASYKNVETWDFSTYNLHNLGLEGGPSFHGKTRAGEPVATVIEGDRWFNVPTGISDWLNSDLKEGDDNRTKGTKDFVLRMPDDHDILIIPIYQGQAGLVWNLGIKDETTTSEEIIWEKSHHIQTKGDDGNWYDMKDGSGNYITNYNDGHTVGKTIRSRAIRIDHTRFSGYFSLFLQLENLDEGYRNDPYRTFEQDFASRSIQSSTQGMMLALTSIDQNSEFAKNVFDELKSSFFSDTKNFMFLGCEDSDISKHDIGNGKVEGGDWDMNDVVFLIVGLSSENVRPNYEELVRKRYMIEDLGGTFDFDFNDIVIDVEQVTDLRNGTKTQKASLRHLCGTIPWSVKIGDTQFGKYPGRNGGCSEGGDGYDPATDLDTYGSIINATVTGWDPDANNIVVTSWPQSAGSDGWTDTERTQDTFLKEADGETYTFAEGGKIPYIIACDPTINWMPESIQIPQDWVSLWKKDIVQVANRLSIQQSTLYVIKSGTDADRVRTIEYSTNSPANVLIECVSASPQGGTAPLMSQDKENQTLTFTADASSTTVGTYLYRIAQAETKYYEGKEIMLTVRVLNEALQINTFTVTPEHLSVEIGQSGVFRYSQGGSGEVSVDEVENVTTTINTTTKEITVQVAEDVPAGTMFVLHVRQAEDAIYYDADKAVTVTVRAPAAHLTPGAVDVWSGINGEINWDVNGKKGIFVGTGNAPGDAPSVINVNCNFDLADHVGEQLIVNVSSNDYNSAKYSVRDRNWGQHSGYDGEMDLPGDFAITITQEMVDKGIFITGKGYTVERITLDCTTNHKGEPIQDVTHLAEGNTVIYDGSAVNTGNWKNRVQLVTNKFQDVQVGDLLIVHVGDELYDTSVLSIRYNNWNQIDGIDEATVITGDYALEITESLLSVFKNNDVYVVGKYVEVTKVTVQRPQVAVTGVSLNANTLTLTIGETNQLTATVNPTNASNKNVTWSSSNTSVATVNNGLVTAVAAGNATITVTTEDGSRTATCEVTVNAPVLVSSVTVSGGTEVSIGSTLQLSASVLPVDAANKTLTWSSSDTNLATVDQNGLVTGKAAGEVTITAKANDGSNVQNSVTITVKAVPVTSITINSSSDEVSVNGTLQLSAVINPSNATNKEVTWSSSDDTKAVVDQTGKVTGVSEADEVTITATAQDGSGQTASKTIRVVQASAVSLLNDPVTASGSNGNQELTLSLPNGETLMSLCNNEFIHKLSIAITTNGSPCFTNVKGQGWSDIWSGNTTINGSGTIEVDLTESTINSIANNKNKITMLWSDADYTVTITFGSITIE